MPKVVLAIKVILLMAILLAACDREPKPIVVTFQLSHTVDTTFNNQYRRSIDREVDSICEHDRQILYDQAVDSLLRIEIAKMEELLD